MTRVISSIIGGTPTSDARGGRLEIPNPAHLSEPVADALLGDATTFVEACRVARAAQEGWARTPAPVRGRAIQQLGRLVEDKSLRVHATTGPEGKTAITSYRVKGHGQDTTLLELSLGTGRRRQIRVQLAAIGHPVVGDREHGGPAGPFRRLCLHATRLGFVHPATDKAMRFESAAPEAWV